MNENITNIIFILNLRMTPARTPSNSRYVDWGHLLLPGKTTSGGSGKPTQLHNLQPTVCHANGIYWGKSGLEIEGVANQWLVESKIHVRRVSIPLTLTQVPGSTGRRTQRPGIKPNITGENVNALKPNDILLYTYTSA